MIDTDGNLYAIEQHLKEQERIEEAEMQHVELTNAWQCGECGEMYHTNSEAGDCCYVETTVKEDVYTCTVCGMFSENINDIKGHGHEI